VSTKTLLIDLGTSRLRLPSADAMELFQRTKRYRRPGIATARASLSEAVAGLSYGDVVNLDEREARALAAVIDRWDAAPKSIQALREGIRRFIGE
jgi:hypothetical protein